MFNKYRKEHPENTETHKPGVNLFYTVNVSSSLLFYTVNVSSSLLFYTVNLSSSSLVYTVNVTSILLVYTVSVYLRFKIAG